MTLARKINSERKERERISPLVKETKMYGHGHGKGTKRVQKWTRDQQERPGSRVFDHVGGISNL